MLRLQIQKLTNETIRRYRNGLKKLQQHLGSQNLKLNDITDPLLSHRIIPGMLDEGLALRTVNCNLCILKEFFKFLYEEGIAEIFKESNDPATRFVIPLQKNTY